MRRIVLMIVGLCVGNVTAHAQAPAKWRLTEEWRKGGASEGAYAFDTWSLVQPLPGGRLAVLDRTGVHLHILDPQGTVVKSIGRQGGGPGEFSHPLGLATAPDGRILVNEPGNGRFSVFTPAGDFVRAVSAARTHPFFVIDAWDGSFDRTGRLLESVGMPTKPARSGDGNSGNPLLDATLATERWTTDFARSDSAATCGAPPNMTANPAQYYQKQSTRKVKLENGPPVGMIATLKVPFTEQIPYFVRDRDGFEWAPLSMGSAELVRRESGRCSAVVARITLSGPRATIPRALRDSELVHVPSEFHGRVPREYPWFHSLHVDDENRLWVERHVQSGRRFEVFTATGQLVAQVDVPAALLGDMPMAVANGHVYAFTKDADDVHHLVAWRVVR